ncbi:Glucan endo-1,3-beta-glucosidase 1 [Platanthera zijinensis]|uniref:Glucan endo-1,3-beta-glucosidase 1 n=1 Tax=Platanthera zijinensis TaxID=2320716 RepID=A0AAP0B192_9ASPA
MPQFDVVTPIPTIPASNPANPTAGRTPSYDPYTTPTMETPSSSSSGSSWCIAAPSAAQASLQAALDYACGHGGTDCSQIKPGGSCFVPDTVRDHASYAFNIYYEKTPIPGSCDFGGNAVITNIDPSTSTCRYPSTSTSSSVLNTTNPSGSTIYGSAPPDSSGRDSMFRTLYPWLAFLGILISAS